jgi:hypothetical protein
MFSFNRAQPRTTEAENPFHDAFRGSFTSLMQWPQLDAFWDTVQAKADAGWYIYCIGEPVPAQPRSAAQVRKFIQEVDALLRRDHDESYCGIVYTDSKTDPSSRFSIRTISASPAAPARTRRCPAGP